MKKREKIDETSATSKIKESKKDRQGQFVEIQENCKLIIRQSVKDIREVL